MTTIQLLRIARLTRELDDFAQRLTDLERYLDTLDHPRQEAAA